MDFGARVDGRTANLDIAVGPRCAPGPVKSALGHADGRERGVEHPLQVILPAADMRQQGAALQAASDRPGGRAIIAG